LSGGAGARAAVTTATPFGVLRTFDHCGFVPGYESTPWVAASAYPSNTPAAIVDKLNQTINALLADPQ